MNPAEELKKIAQDLAKTQKKAVQGRDAEEFDVYADFMDYLNNLGVDEITKMMNAGAPHNWFPSGWSYLDWSEGYPKILAQALVNSTAKESITDLTNMYYSNRNLSSGAIEIFKKDVLQDPAKTLEWITDEIYFPNAFEDLARKATAFVKSILMLLSDDEMKKHIDAVKKNISTNADQYFKVMNINPADYE